MQCGYCTPGMILTAVALLAKNPKPTDEEIAEEMNVNLCRCNGYVKILNAVRRAAEKMQR
jgi:carbon-monoxide dehydrogenase small subunit